jgi:hypothetical protein
MARTARLVTDNHVLKAGVVATASTEQFGKPASNLVSPAPWQDWYSDATGVNQWVVFDLGAARTFQAVQLVKYARHSNGSIKVQANSADSWGAPPVDVTLTLPDPNYTRTAGVWLASPVSYRYVRILFVNSAAALEQVHLGAVVIGPYFEPKISLAPNYGIKRVDLSQVNRTPGGQRLSNRRSQYFEISGTFDKEPETERPGFMSAFQTTGIHTPFIFAINPDDQGYFVFYGRFDSGVSFNHITRYRFGMPFTFSEEI